MPAAGRSVSHSPSTRAGPPSRSRRHHRSSPTSPGNNVAFALGAERLFGIETTERCTSLRVIACELSRIISHLVWLGTTCIDIGAFTPFLWAFQQREKVYGLFEQWIGGRLTTSL